MSSFPVKDCSVLRSSSWEGSFIVLYLLWYGASVNTVCHKDQPVESLHRPNASTHRNLSWDELTWWSRLIRFYIIPSHDKPGVWFTPGPHGKTRKEKIISRRWLRKKMYYEMLEKPCLLHTRRIQRTGCAPPVWNLFRAYFWKFWQQNYCNQHATFIIYVLFYTLTRKHGI